MRKACFNEYRINKLWFNEFKILNALDQFYNPAITRLYRLKEFVEGAAE